MSLQLRKTYAILISVLVFSAVFVSAATQNCENYLIGRNAFGNPEAEKSPLNPVQSNPAGEAGAGQYSTTTPGSSNDPEIQASPSGGGSGGSIPKKSPSSSSPSSAQSSTASPYDLLEQDIRAFCAAINASPDSAFKYPSANRKKTLCNKLLNGFLGAIQEGNYTAALDQLEEIRSKMDGDANHTDKSQGKGHHKQPHYAGNDWVVDDSVRTNLTQYIDNIEGSDYDNDGLSFYDEVATHGTDPLNPDTDGDGLDDGWEVANGFDPLDPRDATADYDHDELTNIQELEYGLDMWNPDTDNDSVNNNFLDGREVRYWCAMGMSMQLAGQYANNSDVDSDGLLDGYEVYYGSKYVWWFEAEDFPAPGATAFLDGPARRSPNQLFLSSAVRTSDPSDELIDIPIRVTDSSIDFDAFPGYNGWAHPAVGDVNGDGRNEIVVGQGPRALFGKNVFSRVAVYNANGVELDKFYPYSSGKGVFVATGDIDGDGDDEIVTGQGQTASSTQYIHVYNYTDSGGFVQLMTFAFGHGGANVACGDLDADGMDEVVAVPTWHGDPDLWKWDIGVNKNTNPWQYYLLSWNWVVDAGYARIDNNFDDGLCVASGNLDGDANDEILVTCWTRGDGRMYMYDSDLSYMGRLDGYGGWAAGVRIAFGDVTGDGNEEIIASLGPHANSVPVVRIYDTSGNILGQFFSLVPGHAGGVELAAGNLIGDNRSEIIASPHYGGVNTRGYQVDFPPDLYGTYKFYTKARRALTQGPQITLQIEDFNSNVIAGPTTHNLAGNYLWYSMPSFTINGQYFSVHALEIGSSNSAFIDKVGFVEFDDSMRVTNTDAQGDQVQFGAGGGTTVIGLDLPIKSQPVPAYVSSTRLFIGVPAGSGAANIQFDVGNNNDPEWQGTLGGTGNPINQLVPDFSGAATKYINSNQHLIDAAGNIKVPVAITSDTAVTVTMSAIRIEFAPNITDPDDTDIDADGVSDGDEVNLHDTIPFDYDSDNDRLDDFEEVSIGNDGYITDPLDFDTDNDRLTDEDEFVGWVVQVVGQQPYAVSSDPTQTDVDNDGLD
ncbi:MAG: VCBS repeat-containing protein, partial [Thermoplasmata archaeon]